MFFPGKLTIPLTAERTYLLSTETAGRSLEGKFYVNLSRCVKFNHLYSDMDVIFALAYNEGVSPVGVSLRKDVPQAGSVEANRILGLDEHLNDNIEKDK